MRFKPQWHLIALALDSVDYTLGGSSGIERIAIVDQISVDIEITENTNKNVNPTSIGISQELSINTPAPE